MDLFEYLTRYANDIIFLTDEYGRIVEANERAIAAYGYLREELLQMNIRELRDLRKSPPYESVQKKVLLENGYIYETYHIRCDGTSFPVESSIRKFQMHGKSFFQLIIRDITERKRVEGAIRESEKKYRTLFEETLSPILVVDENARYIDANKAALEFLECDREELLSKNVWDFAPPHKIETMKQDHNPFMSRRMIETEHLVHGAIKTLMLNVVPLEIKGTTILYGIGQDITERKQAEEVIKTSLREKETLLKEVHHRVKNNMQVISSLLNLQLRRNKNEQVKNALMDCQGRINSMASVHEMLYTSNSLSVVDCQAYISKLTNDILRSYQTGLHRVKLTVDAIGVTLGILQSSTLGLIINEMLSNALKYAFPENSPGEIIIRLKACEGDVIEFVFGDNGIGIPENLNWRNTKSLGLNLIVLLSENQLGGTVRLNPGKGTCFTVNFRRGEI